MSYKSKRGLGQHALFLMLLFLIVSTKAFAMSDEACLECHSDPDMTMEREGKTINLHINLDGFKKTIHADNGCVSCHEDADVPEGEEHPYPLAPVNCANCHDGVGGVFEESAHGHARLAEGNKTAPTCSDCHSKHDILPPTNSKSTTYPLNIPATCGKCHGVEEGENVPAMFQIAQHYTMSIHGQGLYEDGLVVTANCVSCHGSHGIKAPSDPDSSVNRANVQATCTKCHVGVGQQFDRSIHSPNLTKTDKALPICTDCHSDHDIAAVKDKDFRNVIAGQCKHCHEEASETYMENYHGRASLLMDGERVAKCNDCHGSHNILPAHHPESTVNKNNIVQTCAQCHPKATLSFTTYLAHATHKDKEKYPAMFYTFVAMSCLLLGTFAAFWLHTILWIPRSLIERFKHIGKH